MMFLTFADEVKRLSIPRHKKIRNFYSEFIRNNRQADLINISQVSAKTVVYLKQSYLFIKLSFLAKTAKHFFKKFGKCF